MKHTLLTIAGLLLLVSCAGVKTAQMKNPDSFSASCEPAVLESKAGRIEAAYTLTFPEGYFNPSSMMVVTPVLVYDGGQRTGKAVILQGSSVRANYREIPLSGGSVTQKVSFPFAKGMEQSYLELQIAVVVGQRKVSLPAVKVAEGCICTYTLADFAGVYDYKAADYKDTVTLSTELELMYTAGSSDVSGGRRNFQSLNEAKEYIAELEADPRNTVRGATIVAYASPEGGEEYNAGLSKDRAASAQKAWRGVAGSGLRTDVESRGQDWKGLRESIEASDMEDKDLLLRILAMYDDPAERENEIRNLSHLYSDLLQDVFPDLRRASIVVNSEHVNYTVDELREKARKQLFLMTEDELIKLAGETGERDTRSFYYRLAAERYGSQTAYYNLAVLSLDSYGDAVAKTYLARLPQDDADVLNALGVVAMRAGSDAEALEFFAKSSASSARRNAGAILIRRGEYAAAADTLRGTGCFNEALALVLAGRGSEAGQVLDGIAPAGSSPRADYLRAVICARKGDADGVKACLGRACAASEELKTRSARDCEFSGVLTNRK